MALWQDSSQQIQDLLSVADVRLDGARSHDIRVHHPAFYTAVLQHGSRGLGDSYVNGHWDCERLDDCIHRLLAVDLNDRVKGMARLQLVFNAWRARCWNLQSIRRAHQVAHRHYNIDNDLFVRMLDSRMIYSCAYWERADTLEQAQRDKLDMICRKLELTRGERLLDIGCGWGGLAAHAAQHYGVQVVGLTVSSAQQQMARERCRGLPVDIRLQDYRDLREPFDKIVSVGMFEHVGVKNYGTFFDVVRQSLAPNGLFLLHTIGSNVTTQGTDPWIDRYIFPNGKIPSAVEMSKALEGRWIIEDWHNFGQDYDRTLMAWHRNVANAWPELSERYDRRFYRMWSYYLLACAGYFRSRQGQLWQLVLTPRERSQPYRSMRYRPVTPLLTAV